VDRAEHAEQIPRGLAIAALIAISLLAFAIRGLGFQWVFVGDDVILAPGDAMYHARRALYTFENFPAVLFFDPYINYPGGAQPSWPPLYDFSLGALARLFTHGGWGFEAILAWAGPVAGAMTCWPIALTGRLVVGRGIGLGAAALFALLPISVNYSRVGNADHHSVVALIGAWLLAMCIGLVKPEVDARRQLAYALGLTLSRSALLLTWHGSLLYLALAEATIFTAAALGRRVDLLKLEALSAVATLALVAPVVLGAPTPLGGHYSAIALSRLHLLVVVAVAGLAVGLWSFERLRPAQSTGTWFARAFALALGIALCLLLLPGPRNGIAPALQFLTMSDAVGQMTGEQFPLFALFGRQPGRPAVLSWGLFAYLIPVAPIAVLLVAGRGPNRSRVWALAAWAAFFGALALLQRRYSNDLAPAAAVSFAILLAAVGRIAVGRLGGGWVPAGAVAALLGLALYWTPISSLYLPRAAGSLAYLRGEPFPPDRALLTVGGTLVRFGQSVRASTPETSGYFEPGHEPEYGIVAHANIGHALQYVARRATPTDPFWSYIGPENWDRNFAFLGATREAEALPLAEELRARYVVTSPDMAPSTLVGQLHHRDGLPGRGQPRVQQLRLITEAPLGGTPLSDIFHGKQVAPAIPYKLFEIVPGAVLEIEAEPGTPLALSLALRTPNHRSFEYVVRGRLGEKGVVRLRIPYSTEAVAPVRPEGLYRVEIGEEVHSVAVPEAAVREGGAVSVP